MKKIFLIISLILMLNIGIQANKIFVLFNQPDERLFIKDFLEYMVPLFDVLESSNKKIYLEIPSKQIIYLSQISPHYFNNLMYLINTGKIELLSTNYYGLKNNYSYKFDFFGFYQRDIDFKRDILKCKINKVLFTEWYPLKKFVNNLSSAGIVEQYYLNRSELFENIDYSKNDKLVFNIINNAVNEIGKSSEYIIIDTTKIIHKKYKSFLNILKDNNVQLAHENTFVESNNILFSYELFRDINSKKIDYTSSNNGVIYLEEEFNILDNRFLQIKDDRTYRGKYTVLRDKFYDYYLNTFYMSSVPINPFYKENLHNRLKIFTDYLFNKTKSGIYKFSPINNICRFYYFADKSNIVILDRQGGRITDWYNIRTGEIHQTILDNLYQTDNIFSEKYNFGLFYEIIEIDGNKMFTIDSMYKLKSITNHDITFICKVDNIDIDIEKTYNFSDGDIKLNYMIKKNGHTTDSIKLYIVSDINLNNTRISDKIGCDKYRVISKTDNRISIASGVQNRLCIYKKTGVNPCRFETIKNNYFVRIKNIIDLNKPAKIYFSLSEKPYKPKKTIKIYQSVNSVYIDKNIESGKWLFNNIFKTDDFNMSHSSVEQLSIFNHFKQNCNENITVSDAVPLICDDIFNKIVSKQFNTNLKFWLKRNEPFNPGKNLPFNYLVSNMIIEQSDQMYRLTLKYNEISFLKKNDYYIIFEFLDKKNKTKTVNIELIDLHNVHLKYQNNLVYECNSYTIESYYYIEIPKVIITETQITNVVVARINKGDYYMDSDKITRVLFEKKKDN